MKATTSHEEGDRTLKDTMKCTKKTPPNENAFIKYGVQYFFFPAGCFHTLGTVCLLYINRISS